MSRRRHINSHFPIWPPPGPGPVFGAMPAMAACSACSNSVCDFRLSRSLF